MIWYNIGYKLPEVEKEIYIETEPPKDSGFTPVYFARGKYDGENFLKKRANGEYRPIQYVARWADIEDPQEEEIHTYTKNGKIKFYFKNFHISQSNARFVKVLVPGVDGRVEMTVDLLQLPKNQVVKNADGETIIVWNLCVAHIDYKYCKADILHEDAGTCAMNWCGYPAIVVSEIYKLPNGEEIEVPLTSDNPEDLR